jgi:hypothetical protein
MDRDGAGERVVWLPGGLVLVRDDLPGAGLACRRAVGFPAGKPGLGHRMLD